jgi:FolB domain-containing protein
LDHAEAAILDVPGGGRLIDAVAIAQLDAFGRSCRLGELAFGLAGGLEAPDVARLLVLQPDLLGFDAAARRDHRADLGLDLKAVEALRALLPHEHHSARRDDDSHDETDRIFLHDFVVLLAIGAYQAERGGRQRVRFSVDADVRRPREPPTDMRGVFSYDIIIETIRVLAERPHVTFVETLAEELAANLLAYAQITAVTVKVEKLDVIEGSVGIVVRRDRSNAVKPAHP